MKAPYFYRLVFALVTLHIEIGSVRGQGTAFTYQGQLWNGTNPANGNYDISFTVFDAAANGNIIGGPITNMATAVGNGMFTIAMDFGAGVFTGPSRWLQIGVRTNGPGGPFATLNPRQAFTASPYAVTAGNVSGVLPASQIGGTVGVANGGTGQTNASTALSALGGASLGANQTWTGSNVFAWNGGQAGVLVNTLNVRGVILGENGPGTTIYTDPTQNQSTDASLLISSSPYTSGSFFTTQMKMTNQIGGPDMYGYYTWDNQAMSMGSVGFQAAEGNLPGVNLIVMNGEPLAIATSSGTGNLSQIWITHNYQQGDNVIFPLTGDGTRHRPISTSYGAKVFAADGQGSTLWVNEDAGSVSMADAAGGGVNPCQRSETDHDQRRYLEVEWNPEQQRGVRRD
jgi:hypothetical protein